MAYIVPRVLVQQEFTQAAVFANQPLAACIVGPQYKLFRYSEPAEKALIGVGAYVPGSDTAYAYPGQPATSVVDQTYAKVFIENAVAKYFPNDDIDQGSFTATATKLSANKIQTGSVASWSATTALTLVSANGHTRSAPLSNRDVKVGDVITITKADAGAPVTTKVKALHATKSDASIGTVTASTSNAVAGIATHSVAYSGSGSDNQSPSLSTSTYVGYISKGIVSDVYTVTTTTGGASGAARFTISSANGAFTTKTGVTATNPSGSVIRIVVDNAGGNNLVLDLDGAPDITTDDAWTVTVHALVATGNASSSDASNVVTKSGTYTGTADLNYVITVVQGGPFYDGSNLSTCAKVSITSTDTDSSANVNVASNTVFNVGTLGVKAKFPAAVCNGGLVLGDVYYVPATAAKDAHVNIIELQDSLPAAYASYTTDAGLRYTLSLVDSSVVLPLVRDVEYGTLNYTTSATALTVKSGATITDPLVVSTAGPLAKLPVSSGSLFINYRALLLDNTAAISSISDASLVASKLGTIHPDNALAEGVYDAALNSSGAPVYYVGVVSDDLAGYNKAFALVKRNVSSYGLVPLTFDNSVQQAAVALVNATSTPSLGRWKKAWLSTPDTAATVIKAAAPSGANYTAYTSNDKLTVTFTNTGNDAIKLLTSGVRPGDTLLINFVTNPDGSVGYTEVAIDTVVSETVLTLVSALPSVISSGSPVKAQIKRYYTDDERIANMAAINASYANRRVNVAFPDVVKTGSVTKNGYFLAAAGAGARAGTVPHQPLTNSQILGFDDVSKTLTYSEEQLNVLAGAGTFIVAQHAPGGTPFVRHQLTTDSSSLNKFEDSITTNVDSISFGLQLAVQPYIGTYNVNPGTLALIRKAINDELTYRMVNTYTVRAGNQLLGYTIDKLEQNATFKDHVDLAITLQVPAPVNFITITLTV